MVYKLYYFDIRALAEPIRMLLTYGNIEFEDHRIAYADWEKHKDSMPMGEMPVLDVDGQKLHQTVSICRWLAKRVGLDGKTDFENLEIDSVADTIADLRLKISRQYYEPESESKEGKLKMLNEETIPFFLGKLEEIAKANSGHFALKRLTWADILFTGLIEYMNFASKQDLTVNHPHLKQVYENTASIPGIKKWFEIRPKTDELIK